MLKPLIFVVACAFAGTAHAAPGFVPSRQELNDILTDLAAWLAGNWDSFPQIAFGRTLGPPAEGEHDLLASRHRADRRAPTRAVRFLRRTAWR